MWAGQWGGHSHNEMLRQSRQQLWQAPDFCYVVSSPKHWIHIMCVHTYTHINLFRSISIWSDKNVHCAKKKKNFPLSRQNGKISKWCSTRGTNSVINSGNKTIIVVRYRLCSNWERQRALGRKLEFCVFCGIQTSVLGSRFLEGRNSVFRFHMVVML